MKFCTGYVADFFQIQCHYLSGKPGNVREFDSCRGNVRDFTKSQGTVREFDIVWRVVSAGHPADIDDIADYLLL